MNTFWKVNERILKDQIIYDMEKYFSTFFICVQEKVQFAKCLNKSYRKVEGKFAKFKNNVAVGATLTYLKRLTNHT